MTGKKDNLDIKIMGFESIDSDKYDRQKRIAGWDQSKVSNATVMVIGVGATGNELVKNLTLTGIGKFIIIDYDIIEKSNLNRCVLFNMENDIEGKYKVDIVKESIRTLNPDVEIVVYKKELNDIDKNLYKQSNVICSCVDNIEARLEANNYAHYYGIPFIDSGIDEHFGSIQAVYSEVKDAPCLQCGISDKDLDLMWKKFSCTGQEIDSENGETTRKIATIISTTSIIGGIQSQQVIKFILNLDHFKENGKWDSQIGEPLIGKQLNYNGLTNKFNIIEKLKDPNCWTCSYKKSNS
ncbi:MAG: ThiF family adenylyltransferase [Promethearchaeota archaeon]|nr:MAG: ThiF family adenylyltransferase [Candidatus Lokiarchaeota archaeon]